MPVSEAREEFGRLVDAAHFQDDWTVLTKNGEPRAVIVSYEWYREAESRRTALVAGAAGAEAGAEAGWKPLERTGIETPRKGS